LSCREDIEFFTNFFNVSRETLDSLSKYENLLIHHNSKINLIGKSTLDDIWMRHFADSAKIFKIIKSLIKDKNRKNHSICDIGSGAGFPGLVLNILNEEFKFNIDITLIESSHKKCLFLESIRKKLKLDCKIRNARAESLETRYDIIVARAVAPLERLVKISYNIKEKGSSLIFLKGKNWQKEIAQIKKQWKFNMNIVKNDILIDTSGGVTLVLKNLEKKR